jgi:hypothetical protein
LDDIAADPSGFETPVEGISVQRRVVAYGDVCEAKRRLRSPGLNSLEDEVGGRPETSEGDVRLERAGHPRLPRTLERRARPTWDYRASTACGQSIGLGRAERGSA